MRCSFLCTMHYLVPPEETLGSKIASKSIDSRQINSSPLPLSPRSHHQPLPSPHGFHSFSRPLHAYFAAFLHFTYGPDLHLRSTIILSPLPIAPMRAPSMPRVSRLSLLDEAVKLGDAWLIPIDEKRSFIGCLMKRGTLPDACADAAQCTGALRADGFSGQARKLLHQRCSSSTPQRLI